MKYLRSEDTKPKELLKHQKLNITDTTLKRVSATLSCFAFSTTLPKNSPENDPKFKNTEK